jgi:protein-S-isoprenylcysteine O-methyltransferase Ste14
VVAQLALFALVLFGPRRFGGWPAWPASGERAGSIAGAILMPLGALLIIAGALRLGSSLSPLPHPKDDARLFETGAYGIVRHPIYGGGIIMAFGWGLWVHGWATIAYALLLAVFLDIKARREERWLSEKFADYAAYRRRVRKLVPFVY